MSRAVSVSILKGGVGKSTISVNLADRLAQRGHRVLFADLDPNGHATTGLGFEDAYESGADIGDVILDEGEAQPGDVIHETEFGFDILPSAERLETVEDLLRSSSFPDVRVRKHVVEPLLGDVYDYIVTDSPAYRGKLNDNALVATENLIIPLTPKQEAIAGLERTVQRQVAPLQEQIGLEILTIVPNRLQSRIDQDTDDRMLLESLNTNFPSKLPPFARITDEEFELLDDGDRSAIDLPGIRDRGAVSKAFGEGMPLGHFDPENDQLDHFDTLADIVEAGEVGDD